MYSLSNEELRKQEKRIGAPLPKHATEAGAFNFIAPGEDTDEGHGDGDSS